MENDTIANFQENIPRKVRYQKQCGGTWSSVPTPFVRRGPNFVNRILWLKVSKAFDRSIKTPRINSLFSKLFIMSLINYNKVCPVELFTWKPKCLLKETWGQKVIPGFVAYFRFIEKEPCINFCGVLISPCKVIKFWIRREWRHTSECIKYFIPGLLCIFLLILWKKNLLHSFMVVLTVSHKLMKSQSFWLI